MYSLSKHLRLLLGSSFLLVAILGSPLGVIAAETQGIGVNPVNVDQAINPGSSVSGTIYVLNQGNEAFDFTAYSSPYHVSGEQYDPSFTPILGSTNVAQWFGLTLASGHLKAGDQATVHYTIQVPAGTKPGGYYAVVFAQTKVQQPVNGVATTKRVGTIFYLQVSGPVKQRGKVASWGVHFFQQKPLTAVLRMEDDGRLHYTAEVQMQATAVFGHTHYSFDQSRRVLPETIRRITIPWNGSPAVGLFKVSGTVTYLGHAQILPSRYVLVASTPVLILIVACLLGLVIILVSLVVRLKKHKHGKTQL